MNRKTCSPSSATISSAKRVIVTAVASAASLGLIAACGVDSNKTSRVLDRSNATAAPAAKPYQLVGSDSTRPPVRMRGWVPNGKAKKRYKIAFVYDNPANTYELSNYAGIETAAKSLNIDLTMLKLKAFDVQAQLNAVQTIIQQKRFDGVVVGPADPKAECKMLTKSLPGAGIPTVIVNYPTCGDRGYTKGTVALSASQSPTAYKKYAQWVLSRFSQSGGGEMGVLTGPAAFGQSIDIQAALATAAKNFDNVKIVQTLSGDYGPALGFSQAQTLLQTHPHLKLILTMGDQITLGAQKALTGKGLRPGDVQLYNLGGQDATFQLMRQKWIQGTFFAEPVEETAQGLELLVAYLQGVAVPAFNDLSVDPTLPNSSNLVTQENMAAYKPES